MSLFLRCFVISWGSSLLLIAAVATFYQLALPDRDQQVTPRFSERQDSIRLYSRGLRIAAVRGERAVAEWAHRLRRPDRERVYLINQDNEDLLSRDLPKSISATAALINDANPAVAIIHNGVPVQGRLIYTREGAALRFLILGKFSQRAQFVALVQRSVVFLLLLSLVLSACVSWWISRLIVKPVKVLARATRNTAAGRFHEEELQQLATGNDELAHLAADFSNMNIQIETLLDKQRRLISNVAHEIRTPLARLQLAAELLATAKDASLNAKHVQSIQRQITQLIKMVNELLELERLSNGETPLAERVSVKAVLDSSLQQFDQTQQERLSIAMPDRSISFISHGDLLSHAVGNIIANALRHQPTGQIDVTVTRNKHLVNVDILDRGPGVPEAILKDIFAPFVRADSVRGRTDGGVGLGLALSKTIVELHGGEITASNRDSGGLRVRLVLPIAKVAKGS
ncbi:HAMP domain-containing sensor histidine kinase [uncultured Umboniibacter sp.]|uniref:HAMP domain-containing sensor histidine kinase n=1 Tax=uncultured Umboniibacter sp. TaxID=1798917 RepID=UPI0026312CFF|nr:HAMP domain-containing sensor histidine kinase [uncultured Umboniibacter sp.]